MQKVEIYYSMLDAKNDIRGHLSNGWKVHTCTMGCFMAGYNGHEKVLVVYERDN